jgi:hypothetical protein
MSGRAKPVYSDGVIHVMPDKCATCIFHAGNRMTLEAGRVKGMVTDSIRDGGCIPCHKTTYGQRDQEAVCRGFFDSYGERVPALAEGARLGIIEEVESAAEKSDG